MADLARARRRKHRAYLRSQGVAPYIPNTEVRAHIAHLMTSLSIAEIARRCDMQRSVIRSHSPKGTANQIRPAAARVILSVRLGPEDLTREERRTGAQRIIKGLMTLGFTTPAIAREMGLSSARGGGDNCLPNVIKSGADYVPSAEVYATLVKVAQKLEAVNPRDIGVGAREMNGNKAKSRNKRWAPVAAWDYETVHLAESYPNWTGACGRMAGYRIHIRDDIPMCEPCQKRSDEMEAEANR